MTNDISFEELFPELSPFCEPSYKWCDDCITVPIEFVKGFCIDKARVREVMDTFMESAACEGVCPLATDLLYHLDMELGL